MIGTGAFGSAWFGGEVTGYDPGYIITRMLGALSSLRRSGTSGILETCARLTGNVNEPDDLARMTSRGTPAVLIGYMGATFEPYGSNGVCFVANGSYQIVCIASSLQSREERLSGNRDKTWSAGLDHLPRLALHFILREMGALGNVHAVAPIREDVASFSAEHFISTLELSISSTFDAYDDAVTTRLERLGIVHTPETFAKLFEDDNETPNSSDDTNTSPSVAELRN